MKGWGWKLGFTVALSVCIIEIVSKLKYHWNQDMLMAIRDHVSIVHQAKGVQYITVYIIMFPIVCLVGVMVSWVLMHVHVHVHVYTCTQILNVALKINVCGSAHCCGCMVNGSIAKTAFWVLQHYWIPTLCSSDVEGESTWDSTDWGDSNADDILTYS